MAGLSGELYGVLTGDDEGRVCRDIPESACAEQPGNFTAHLTALALTKAGDGFAEPKIVLTWLFAALGVPAYLTGLLVPIREAGALLPQLFIAGAIRRLSLRKYVWTGGSLLQGLAVLTMAGAAWTLSGVAAGAVILACLAVFAVARSMCSVSYKDVLGKTVTKSARGTVTGTATSLASGAVLLFGLVIFTGVLERDLATVTGALLCAGGLWLVAASVFLTLRETPGATEGGRNAWALAVRQFGLLKQDGQLRLFILTRGFLMASALSPPFLLMLSQGENGPGDNGLSALGAFLTASALAGFLSSYLWGRLSDRSSRKVLALAGLGTFLALALGLVSTLAGGGGQWLPVWLFVLMISHQGVRLGRSTHIVDMADADKRAAYTALSNTLIGFLLVLGGTFGVLASAAGVVPVVAILAVMGLLGALAALGLEEVQAR